MDGLEVFAILIISIIVIMMFQGTLGMPAIERKEHRRHHHHSKHHHPYHPHRRHPHHSGRLYEGFSDENLFKNSSDVEQRNYGVYDDDSLKHELAAEIFAEV
jgi:hypothetical protein